MARKNKTPGYLSPKKLLSPSEYKQYKEQQQETRRIELQEKVRQGQKNLARFKSQQAYGKSRTGRFGKFLARNLQRAQTRGGFTQALYQQQIPINYRNVQQEFPSIPRTLKGSSGGRVGRPRQTYDRRYAAYGGVYGYRKMLAAKLRAEKLQLIARANISPQQQMIINRIQAQQVYEQQNPENKVIPDTSGNVPTRNIMNEIDIAANLVP